MKMYDYAIWTFGLDAFQTKDGWSARIHVYDLGKGPHSQGAPDTSLPFLKHFRTQHEAEEAAQGAARAWANRQPASEPHLNNDPVEAGRRGRWRSTLTMAPPDDPWRERFDRLAKATAEAKALNISIEGSTVVFDCPDSDDKNVQLEALRGCHRLINRLIRETHRTGGS